jgi:DNA helicase HerA-like ATPase
MKPEKRFSLFNSIEARRATSLIVAQEYSSGPISLERISVSLQPAFADASGLILRRAFAFAHRQQTGSGRRLGSWLTMRGLVLRSVGVGSGSGKLRRHFNRHNFETR